MPSRERIAELLVGPQLPRSQPSGGVDIGQIDAELELLKDAGVPKDDPGYLSLQAARGRHKPMLPPARDAMPYTAGPDPNEPPPGEGIAESMLMMGGGPVAGAGSTVARMLASPAVRATIGGGALATGALAPSAMGQDQTDFGARQQQLATRRTETLRRRDALAAESDAMAKLTSTSPAAEIQAAQERLSGLGFSIKPDGKLGTNTRDAIKQFQTQMRRDLEAVGEELARLDTATKDLDRAGRQAAGDKRLREMDAGRSTFSTIMQDYAAPVGYAAGVALPFGLSKASDFGRKAMAARAAARGDEIMRGAPRGNWQTRAGRVQDFWTTGGSRQQPFVADAAARRGFAANPDPRVRPSGDLYQGRTAPGVATDVALGGVAGADWAYAAHAIEPAQAELGQAQQAVSADPSEANIQRLQTAKDNVAFYQALVNAGRAGTATSMVHGAGRVVRGLVSGPPQYARPSPASMSRAESERMSISDLLARDAMRGGR